MTSGLVSRSGRGEGVAAKLDLYHATVDEELDAGDVARVIRRKEDDHLGNFVGMPHAAERHLRSKPSLQLFRLLFILGEAVDCGCVDRTRAHDIDANLAVLELIRPRPSEGTDSGFGGA